MIKHIQGHDVDDKFLFPGVLRYEWDKGLSWKPIETPNQCPTHILRHFTCSYNLEDTVGYFQNEGVSVHFVIGKKGEVVQMSPVCCRAAHAGASQWDTNHDGKITSDEMDMNRYSIGLEFVNLGPLEKRGDKYFDCWDREFKGKVRERKSAGYKYWEEFTPEQEKADIDICLWACQTLGIKPENIIGHDESTNFKRKNDPGGTTELTGPEYREYIKSRLSAPKPIPAPIANNKIHILKTKKAIEILNYLKQPSVANDDFVFIRPASLNACFNCGKATSTGDILCSSCHSEFNNRIIVI